MERRKNRVRHVRFQSRSLPKSMVSAMNNTKNSKSYRSRSKGGGSRRRIPSALKRSKSSRAVRIRTPLDGISEENHVNGDDEYVMDDQQVEVRARARSSAASLSQPSRRTVRIYEPTQPKVVDVVDGDDDVATRERPRSVVHNVPKADEWDNVTTRSRGVTSGPTKKQQQERQQNMFVDEAVVKRRQHHEEEPSPLEPADQKLIQEWNDAVDTLKDVSPTLSKRIRSLNRVTAVFRSGVLMKRKRELVQRVTTMSSLLISNLNDRHLDVVTAASQTVLAMARQLGRTRVFDDVAKNIAMVLLKLHHSALKQVCSIAMATCHDFIDCVNPLSVIEVFVFGGVSDNHKSVRLKSCEYLSQILLNIVDMRKQRRFSKHHGEILDKIASVVHANGRHREPSVKEAAIGLAQILQQHFA